MSSEPPGSGQPQSEPSRPGTSGQARAPTSSLSPPPPQPSGESGTTLRPDTARTAVELRETASQEGGGPPPPPSTSQVQISGVPHPRATVLLESPIDGPAAHRNRSNATLGSDRPDPEVTSPAQMDVRVSRHATLRTPGGERPFNGRPRTGDSMRRSTLDWVVPVEERAVHRHTVEERLHPTLEHAMRERDKLKLRASSAKWAINATAGLQVFLGALTTGFSAVRLDGQKLGIATTVLGILSTLTGAFLARVRATEEPEGSLIRAHDLDAFIRDVEAFCLDYGHDAGDTYTHHIEEFRRRFEMLLGNIRAEAVRSTQKSGEGAPKLPTGPDNVSRPETKIPPV